MNDAAIAADISAGSTGAGDALPAGVISDATYEGLPFDDQANFARVKKGPDGGSQWQERSTLPPERADSDPPAADAIDPARMQPGEKIKLAGKDGTVFELDAADVSRLMETQAAEALRKATLPADAAAYEVKLPDTFKPPPGVELTIDNTDPALFDLKNWAHKRGLSQAEFSDVLGIYAAREARQAAVIQTAAQKQIELLGTNGAQRVDAVSQFLRSMVGDELAKPMLNVMATEKIVRGYEKLMQRVASQGAASFSQLHRVPADGERVSNEAWSKMTQAERWEYSRQHDQKQMPAWRDPRG